MLVVSRKGTMLTRRLLRKEEGRVSCHDELETAERSASPSPNPHFNQCRGFLPVRICPPYCRLPFGIFLKACLWISRESPWNFFPRLSPAQGAFECISTLFDREKPGMKLSYSPLHHPPSPPRELPHGKSRSRPPGRIPRFLFGFPSFALPPRHAYLCSSLRRTRRPRRYWPRLQS